MTTTDMIRKLCEEKNISIAELARRIGQSPQNFGKKLKRETVSQQELNQIADVLGVSYEQAFASINNDGSTDMGTSSDDNSLVEKYISEELGLTITLTDDDQSVDDDYVKLDDGAFSKINSIFQSLPHYANELRAQRLSADTYKVIYDKGLGHLQQSAKNRDRFRSNVVAFGTNNDITGQAELEKFQLKITSPALAAFDIAAIATNQYYLARIDSKLASLDNKLDYVQKFLEESKKSDLWANGQLLRDISGKIYEISQDDQYRQATLATVQGIRRDALSNVKFYHKMMTAYMETHLDKNLKDFPETKRILNHFYDCFDAYCYAVYVYGFAYVIEVALSQITDGGFLNKVRDEIQDVIDGFQSDYTKELKQFIDNVKSLNPGVLAETFSGHTPRFHTYGRASWVGLLFDAVALGSNLAVNYDKRKKKSQKDEVEKQFKKLQARTEKSIDDIDSPIEALERMNDMYNKPVEILVQGDSAYVKLNTLQEDDPAESSSDEVSDNEKDEA